MKRWFFGVLGAAAILAAILPKGAKAAVLVPEYIYEWVQSTARQSYYFNKAQMHYGVKDGIVDLNILVVPTLRTYDAIQIQDVVSKRRWKQLSLDGYDGLVGAAEYLTLNLKEGTVRVTQHDDLDQDWGTIFSDKRSDEEPIRLANLSDKDVDGKFYQAIIAYANAHQIEIASRTNGTLTEADKKILEAKRKEWSKAQYEKDHPEEGNQHGAKDKKDNKKKNRT